MNIDKDDDRCEPSTTRSTFPEQERKYFVEFPCYTSDTYYFDVNAYVDSIIKNVNEEIERRLADIGYIKVVRCKDCKFFDRLTSEMTFCVRGSTEEEPNAMVMNENDYCSKGERRGSDGDDTDTD